MSRIPNPGSAEAATAGCNCPIKDNHEGVQDRPSFDGWWTSGNCRLHDTEAFRAQENAEDLAALIARSGHYEERPVGVGAYPPTGIKLTVWVQDDPDTSYSEVEAPRSDANAANDSPCPNPQIDAETETSE